MYESRYRWRNREIREHVDVLDGKRSPSKVLYNATYLHGMLRQWLKGNIWIYQDRIVYVGERMPSYTDESCELVDCHRYYLVPGYFEPHAHPFQLYNPLSFAQYSSKFGTTIIINDNLPLVLNTSKKEAFSLLHAFQSVPATMYWWSRFDSQTNLPFEEKIFSNSTVKAWIDHPSVVQGGELTGWPKLMDGDDLILHWIQETKRQKKRVEGHFPGASEKTLAKMKLLGTDSDHEAMTGEEVKRRLLQGYMVPLRYSSIRPDLPTILDDLKDMGITSYENFMLTTDGSPSSFYENGMIDRLIEISMEKGVPAIDAYLMATLNPAKYYQLDHLHGMIATGRVANINFLSDISKPKPVSVMTKGEWIVKENVLLLKSPLIKWDEYGLSPLAMEDQLTLDDLQFSMPFGIQMENAVITKPYSITLDLSVENIDDDGDECFFMLFNRHGHWRINTLLKGFTDSLSGFVSTFTNSGDILLLGKRKKDMVLAFDRMRELGGGIVIAEDEEVIYELPLTIGGIYSELDLEELIVKEKQLKFILSERGYKFEDPIYSLLFFSSTHLPYIRITPSGIYDVMKKRVLFPAIMR